MKRKLAAIMLATVLALPSNILALAAEVTPVETGTEGETEISDTPENLVNPPRESEDSTSETEIMPADGIWPEEDEGSPITYVDESSNEEDDGRVASGVFGEGGEWVLTDDGVLTFSGSGVIDVNVLLDSPYWEQRVTSVKIEDGITGIGAYAFYYYPMTEVSIPGSVKEIGNCAFEHCDNLTEVSISNGVTKIGGFAFAYSNSLTKIIIPDSVNEIERNAFAYCNNLTEVSISKGIKELRREVFRGCENLKEVSIPNSVTKIEYRTFSNCTSLPEITIPSSVKTIGHGAFADCEGLQSVAFEGDAPEIDSGNIKGGDLEPFYNVTATATHPQGNRTWTEETRRAYGEKLRWITVIDKTVELKIVPEVTDNTYIIGSARGARIKCTGELKDFLNVYMDDVEVERSNYTLEEGSTILTFTTMYLDTLAVGKHKVTLNYTYGSVDTDLTILANSSDSGTAGTTNGNSNAGNVGGNTSGNTSAPRTGDNAPILPWSLAAILAVSVCIILRSRKYMA